MYGQTKRAAMSKRIKDYCNTHPEYRAALSHPGRKHTEATKKKISESNKKAATPELRKFRSESRKGVPHPHKSGRKGIPLSEFGKLFYAHYGFISSYNPALYRKELRYWSRYHIASWELYERMDEYNT